MKKMKLNPWLIAALAGAQCASVGLAADNTTTGSDTDINALQQEINDLDQKVRILERQRELDKEDAATAATKEPTIKFDSSGFTFSSPDANFIIGLHGLIQLDSRTFFGEPGVKAGSDDFLLRRARPILTGTVFHNFDFNFTPDFGGSAVVIYDAYINYHYNPALQLEFGKFKSPVGLETLQSDTWLFFNERTLANNLSPNRDIGAELHGDLFGGVASYAAGIFDGAPDYSSPTSNVDVDNNTAFAGRVFFQPAKNTDLDFLRGLGVGLSGSYEVDRGGASGLTAGYVTDGQQKFFTYSATAAETAGANGGHWRISPQGYYYYGPFGLIGEYLVSDQAVTSTGTGGTFSTDLDNTGWEISAGWVLTGEDDSYNGVTPKHPFNPAKGQWGAWQVVARYAELNVDHKADTATFATAGSALTAHGWSAGINWYLNRDIRVNASFSHTQFGDLVGTASAITKQAENTFFTRVQLAF
jgi:phosphate-selective porin OprO/OprP